MDERTATSSDVPLVVDLDGTLIKTDSLHEAFVQLFSRKPIQALCALLALTRGRAAFKATIADYVLPDVSTLQVDEAVVESIKQARLGGRLVYLATAADRRVAQAIADSIGGFDGVFGSADGINLKGKEKERNKDLRRGSNWATSLLALVFKHGPLMAALI